MRRKILTLVVMVVVAGVAFAGSFLASRWLVAEPQDLSATEPGKATKDAAGDEGTTDLSLAAKNEDEMIRLKERQLHDLIQEVREKIRGCQVREEQLAQWEKRVEMARSDLKKDAEELDALRVQLAASTTRLKEARAELDQSRIRIRTEEVANLKRTAQVYDKMDSVAGSEILATMCANNQIEDVVKILRYMTDRAVAKVLAGMSDKKTAALLCEHLRRVQEQG